MHISKFLLLILSAALLLAGCAAATQAPPPDQPVPTAPATRPVATLETAARRARQIALSRTREAEARTHQTQTGPVPTATRTPPPIWTPVPSWTPWREHVNEIFTGRPSMALESSISPDGRWQAEVERYECFSPPGTLEQYALERLFLTRLSDGEQQVIEEQSLLCQGVGAWGLGKLDWSDNSRFLYYTTAREGVPDGGGCGWHRPLNAYEVESGVISQLTQGARSLDGRLLAAPAPAWTEELYELIVWDWEAGEQLRLALHDPQMVAASLAWRADRKQLVYLQMDWPCVPDSRSVLVRVTLANQNLEVLLETEESQYVAVEWFSADTLVLRTFAGETVTFDPPSIIKP